MKKVVKTSCPRFLNLLRAVQCVQDAVLKSNEFVPDCAIFADNEVSGNGIRFKLFENGFLLLVGEVVSCTSQTCTMGRRGPPGLQR